MQSESFDFCKAFYSLHHPSLLSILRYCGVKMDILQVIKDLYEPLRCPVQTSASMSDWFTVVTEVQQGCILSTILFPAGAHYHSHQWSPLDS